jgi:TonB family protein
MKNQSRKPESFITQPTYPGGTNALNEFIAANLKYPEEAITNNIQGTVSVDFDIDIFGKVVTAKIKHGLGYGCDEEAIRLIKLLKFTKRRYQGMRVVFHRNLNIHFKLHSAAKIVDPAETKEIRINYSTPAPSEETKPNVINIQVNFTPEKPKE